MQACRKVTEELTTRKASMRQNEAADDFATLNRSAVNGATRFRSF
jgi:hypothetical protein